MGQKGSSLKASLRTALVPHLEKALATRDADTARQVAESTSQRAAEAARLNKPYHDPTALYDGFTRGAGAAKRLAAASEMPPDLIKFMELGGPARKKEYTSRPSSSAPSPLPDSAFLDGATTAKGVPLAKTFITNRPLPSSRSAPDPVVAPARKKGELSSQSVKELLEDYQEERVGGAGGVGATGDELLSGIAELYGLEKEEVLALVTGLGIPEVSTINADGDQVGAWKGTRHFD